MTVKELIEELKKYPEDYKIVIVGILNPASMIQRVGIRVIDSDGELLIVGHN